MKNKSKKATEDNSTLEIIGNVIIFCFAGFSTVFFPINILSFFGIIQQESLKSPWIFAVYIETALIAGLARAVHWLIKKHIQDNKLRNVTSNSTGNGYNSANAIVDIITQAYAQKRYAEVICIGNAVSEYLWYCGKKEQRLQIAGYVLKAAEKQNDYYTIARVRIEDIGNTLVGRSTTETKKEAIKQITKGIEIAEQEGYGYLIARGYRNLACANIYLYAAESIKSSGYLTNAETNIEKAKEALNSIPDSWEKTDAEASLNYAMYRLYHQRSDKEKAIEALLKAKSLYEECPQKASKNTIITERLKKIYRELGAMYVEPKSSDELCASEEEKEKRERIREEGFILLDKAISMCEADDDLPNLCRTAIILLENAHDDECIQYAAPVKSTCRKVMPRLSDRDKNTRRLKELLSEDRNNMDN